MELTMQRAVRAALGTAVCIAGISMNAGLMAQGFTTTTVQGTVYLANGAPGAGILQISWPAFTTANNQAVAAGRTNVTIAADGFVSVKLTPNLGAAPAGLYYTAVYHLTDGTTSTEYWVVPAAAQASLSQVRAQVMPAAQAVQAVSKGYVDQSIAELTQSLLTASGGSLSGPLYLNGDPSQPGQAATKRYVDHAFANALPVSGGAASGPLTSVQLGAAYQVDQFPGADFGARLQACLNQLDPVYGGTCDARNFSGNQGLGASILMSAANATVELPCATIATANPIVITPGTRNVTFHGCASRGASDASGSQGGTVFLYSGTGPMVQVGDPTYAMNTLGFHLDNVVINTTASADAQSQAFAAYRTQEIKLESIYLLGNSNQTGITLDGTGNYTGGTFQDIELGGFGTALKAIGHQVTNPAITDWVNASTFVRLHINCPTSNGNPMAGTYGIDLLQGDGNTFTGGDVEGCATALHLGPNAQNNTIVGLRNENSTSQVVADAGSSYNNWITGGTMFTGKLADNGTRNSFLDTFHRSFNGLNGDWYGSQADTTITNHYRLGTGTGNERGLLDRYQTDWGYRWTMGLSDAGSGEQFYQLLDELNNVYRLSIGQYNPGHPSTNNQTVVNSAGTGAVVLNGSANAGTGGVIFGSGGPASAAVATINNAGNAQFNGSLLVGGASTFSNSTTVKNQADAEIDSILWAGTTANQKESFTYKDYLGASQWYMLKDANNNWALNSAVGGINSFKAYQSNNSGDTYINASNSSGHIRFNYEPGSGSETDIYSGPNAALVAAFLGTNAIKFPGLAAGSGRNCLQIDNSGYISNTGSPCASGGGTSGTVNTGNAGQVAYYSGNGTVIAGTTSVAVTAGGTGATTATQALQNLGAQAALPGVASDGASGVTVGGNIAAGGVSAPTVSGTLYAARFGDRATNGIATASSAGNNQTVIADPSYPSLEKPGPFTFSASPFHYVDQRMGQETHFHRNPQYGSPSTFNMGIYPTAIQAGHTQDTLYDQLPAAWTGNIGLGNAYFGIQVNSPGWNCGNALNGTSCQGWQTTGNIIATSQVRGSGISESLGVFQYKYGTGDSAPIYAYNNSEGGSTGASDESNKTIAANNNEDADYFTGTCSSGCTNGSQLIKTTVTNAKQGTGRYIINTTQGPTFTGHVTNITTGLASTVSAVTVDQTVPVSNAWGTLATQVSTPVNPQSPFITSETFNVNVTSGTFVTGTVACFAANYHDQVAVTAAGTPSGGVQQITVNSRKPHAAGSVIMQGGMCAQGFEWTAYTFGGLQYLFDVVGSTDSHTLQVTQFLKAGNVNVNNFAYVYQTINMNNDLTCVSTTCSGTVANTGTLYHPWTWASSSVVIAGASDPSLNTTCANMQWTSPSAYSCTIAGLSGTHTTSSAPTATLDLNGFKTWRIAEVIDVQNETLSPPQVDGTLALEANVLNISPADTIIETHHVSSAWITYSGGMYPNNPFAAMSGIYQGFAGRGVQGGGASTAGNALLYLNNANPYSFYKGYGGNIIAPNGYQMNGPFNIGLNFGGGPAKEQYLIFDNVSATQQYNDPTYTFSPLGIQSGRGGFNMNFTPYTGNLSFNPTGVLSIGGSSNVITGNSNASTPQTTVVGNVYSGGTGSTTMPFVLLQQLNVPAVSDWVTGGTMLGIQSPNSFNLGRFLDFRQNNGTSVFSVSGSGAVAMAAGSTVGGSTIVTTAFGPSGSSHSAGLVPDPGSTTGATRYLREDGQWVTPSGAGGFPIVVAHASYTGLTAAQSNLINYTPLSDGMFRLTITGIVTTACTSGNIGSGAYLTPVAGHGVGSGGNMSCSSAYTTQTWTTVQHSVAGIAINPFTTFNSVVGTPAYNIDVVLEQLQ